MCQVELRGRRHVWHDLHTRDEDGARVYACSFNTLKVENRRELKPNTAIYVVLLHATKKQLGYELSDDDVGDLFTVIGLQIKGDVHVGLSVGHQGYGGTIPVADRNEHVVRGNRFSMPRGCSSVALTAMSVSLSGHSLRFLWEFST